MPTALRRSEPVTIEAFDAFVEAQADTALLELVEGGHWHDDEPRRGGEQGFELEVLTRPDGLLHYEAVEFRIDLMRIYFDVRCKTVRQ